MNTVTLSKGVHIQSLTRIALILSSLATIPGFFGSLYLLVIAANELSPEIRTLNANDWLTFAPLMVAMVMGWWLYYTYWLELQGVNRFGKVSWFVSALVNLMLAVYPLSDLRTTDNPNAVLNSILLLWLTTMMIISVWVWVLKIRETL